MAEAQSEPPCEAADVAGPLALHIRSLHRTPAALRSRYRSFTVKCGVYYAGRLAIDPVDVSNGLPYSGSMFAMISWKDGKCEFDVPISHLPRETRLLFTVLGVASESMAPEPVGWVTLPLFDHDDVLCSGDRLLGLWTDPVPRLIGVCEPNMLDDESVLLAVSLPVFDRPVKYSSSWRRFLDAAPAADPGLAECPPELSEP